MTAAICRVFNPTWNSFSVVVTYYVGLPVGISVHQPPVSQKWIKPHKCPCSTVISQAAGCCSLCWLANRLRSLVSNHALGDLGIIATFPSADYRIGKGATSSPRFALLGGVRYGMVSEVSCPMVQIFRFTDGVYCCSMNLVRRRSGRCHCACLGSIKTLC